VVDVSAQSCSITSTRPDGLDTPSEVIINGTENVKIGCRCVDENNSPPHRVRWFDPGMNRVVGQGNAGPGNPYCSNNNNLGRSNLFIPIFSASTSGVYTCGDNLEYGDIMTMLTINLQLGKD